MNFCDDCDNMLYERINDDHNLEYICKTCGRVYEGNLNENQCVYEENYEMDTIKKESFLNKYTFDDPTLPKAEGIKCPNDNCPGGDKTNIVYMNYDNKDMKYLYVCLSCKNNTDGENTSFIW
jgi:DNA-directed RNA polymerase subunit M/transcription elongation factor TFIIS